MERLGSFPVSVLSFRANHMLHGLSVFGYHAVNVALHAVVCMLYFRLCRDTFGSTGDGYEALFAALLFAVHPVHAEAVASLAGRADVLCALFFLLSLMLYKRACAETLPRAAQLMCAALSVALCGVSMLCKEIGVTAVGVCFVYDAVVLHGTAVRALLLRPCRSRSSSAETAPPVAVEVEGQAAMDKEPERDDISAAARSAGATSPDDTSDHRRRSTPLGAMALRLAVLVAGGAALMAARLAALGGGLPTFVTADNPAAASKSMLTRALTFGYLAARHGWLLLWPQTLCVDWAAGSIPLVESWSDPRNAATALLLSCLCWLAARIWAHCGAGTAAPLAQRQALALGAALCAVPFLPCSNLLFTVGFVLAERVLYVPSLGFCMLASQAAGALCTAAAPRVRVRRGRLLGLVCSAVLAAACARTVLRNEEWANQDVMFTSALQTNPANFKLWLFVGNLHWYAGRHGEAAEHYQRGVVLADEGFPGGVQPSNLRFASKALLKAGRTAEAEGMLQRLLGVSGGSRSGGGGATADTHVALGEVLMSQKGRAAEAEAQFRLALRTAGAVDTILDHKHEPSPIDRLVAGKDQSKTIRVALSKLGGVCLRAQRHAEAAVHYRRLLRVARRTVAVHGGEDDEADDEVVVNLVTALAGSKTYDQAEQVLRKFMVREPPGSGPDGNCGGGGAGKESGKGKVGRVWTAALTARLGVLQLQQGRGPDAKKSLKCARDLDPREKTVRSGCQILKAMGHGRCD